MKEWFLACGYPEKIVKEQIKLVVFGKKDKRQEDSTKGVPFVVTFHPKLIFLAKKIKELSKYLHLDLEVKAMFTPALMVSFRSTRKITDYLVRAKLYLLQRSVGSRKCNQSRCKVIILKVQISFLAQLLVRHIKSIITLTVIVNV